MRKLTAIITKKKERYDSGSFVFAKDGVNCAVVEFYSPCVMSYTMDAAGTYHITIRLEVSE